MGEFRFFYHYCWKQQKAYIVLLFLAEVFQTIFSISGIIFPKYIIDALFSQRQIEKAVGYVVLFLMIVFSANFLNALTRYYAERSRDQMYCKFSLSFARQIMEGDYQNMESPEYLDLKEKALKCMAGNYGFAGFILLSANLFGKLLLLGSLIAVARTMDIRILLVFLALIVVNVWINNRLNQKNAQLDMESVTDKRKESYYHSLGEDVNFAKEVRLNGLQSWILNLYQSQFGAVHGFVKQKNVNTCKSTIVGLVIIFLQQCAAYGFLVLKVFEQGFTMGQFTMYLSAMLSFNGNVTELLTIVGKMRQGRIYLKPFQDFMFYPKKMEAGEKANIEVDVLNNADYHIRFDHVSFRYPGQDRYALKDVSCEIHLGERLAIVGQNGAGKSTFIKLLTRLYDPEEGHIYLNDKDIKTIKGTEYRALLSVVFQDYKLFAMTIKENIGLDKSGELDGEELDRVADTIGLKQKVDSLEQRFDTPVYKIFDEGGFEPSGGEAQKIAMARAFVKNAPIVILDEPTAALDPRAEYELYQDFDKLTENKTVIYISHRLASCRVCDRIFVFADGGIEEQGTHDELMEQNGHYAEMFKTQAELYVQ